MRYAFIALILLCRNSLAQSITVEVTVDRDHFFKDEIHRLILCQANLTPYQFLPDSSSVQLTVENDTYLVVEKQLSLSYDTTYTVQNEQGRYHLFFTQLPIISIESKHPVIDASKVKAKFKYVDNAQVLTSPVGIELRGGYSLSYPKKTYDLELRTEFGDKSREAQFGDLREDDDWILDALYNEPLRIRSFISHKLWLAIHTLAYQDKEPEAKAGADVMWAEVFFQNKYRGIYMLSEQVDRKLLKLKKFEHGKIKGELFKGARWGDAVLFRGVPSFNTASRRWDGYEAKYPNQEDTTDWTALRQMVNFVVNEDSAAFTKTVANWFELRNAVNYFIFLNLLWADDNRGKNIYVARYNQKSPYFYVPWDLDATWGLIYTGARHNTTTRILSNGLYRRLTKQHPEFNIILTKRWNELRNSILREDAIISLIDEARTQLLDNNVYEREQLVWDEYVYDSASVSYLKAWVKERLAYLDTRFGYIVLSADDPVNDKAFRVYPNPTSSVLNVAITDREPISYNLLSIQGHSVKSGTVSSTTPVINVADFRPGYYILRIKNINRRVLITK